MITFRGHLHRPAGKLLLLIGVTIGFSTMAQTSASEELQLLNRGSAKFSTNLFSVLRKANPVENLIVSPLSLQIALALVYAGADGKTKDELAKLMHIDLSDDTVALKAYKQLIDSLKKPGLKLATSVFFNKTLKLRDSYKAKVDQNFGGDFGQVDFANSTAAANTINKWCQKNTNQKIEKLFEPSDLDSNVMAVIANAIHFKANWRKKFDSSRTDDMDFHGLNGVTKVKMMHQTGHFKYGQVASIQAQILELPYENGDFRMLIILPFPDVTLEVVDVKMKGTDFRDILKEMYSTEVVVSLPRFKIESELDLEGALKELGVVDMFKDSANLSGISSDPLFVSKVKQKAFIEVNEEGTEAAAVTGMAVMVMSLPPPPKHFDANRPFLVVILHSDTSIVFQGTIVKLSN